MHACMYVCMYVCMLYSHVSSLPSIIIAISSHIYIHTYIHSIFPALLQFYHATLSPYTVFYAYLTLPTMFNVYPHQYRRCYIASILIPIRIHTPPRPRRPDTSISTTVRIVSCILHILPAPPLSYSPPSRLPCFRLLFLSEIFVCRAGSRLGRPCIDASIPVPRGGAWHPWMPVLTCAIRGARHFTALCTPPSPFLTGPDLLPYPAFLPLHHAHPTLCVPDLTYLSVSFSLLL